MREKEAEAEKLAKEQELEEENAKLEKEIEQEIQGRCKISSMRVFLLINAQSSRRKSVQAFSSLQSSWILSNSRRRSCNEHLMMAMTISGIILSGLRLEGKQTFYVFLMYLKWVSETILKANE